MRILLPVRPDNDCAEPARIIDALFGREAVSILRIFVYRPAELDAYVPEVLAAVPGLRRLDDNEVRAAVDSTRVRCRALLEYGFHVESAIVGGFPVDKIIAETKSWKADLILLHVTQEKPHECRIGQMAGQLIDGSPVPVLLYPKFSDTVGKRICVLSKSSTAMQWARVLAARQNGEIQEIRDEDVAQALTGHDCDLLVVSAQHHFAPSILGSTERRIVRHADVPVALIPS